MLPLVSGINFRLLSVDHELISLIPSHPVLRLALLPLVPSTYHSRLPPFLHSFIPKPLKPSFSANPPPLYPPFLLRDWWIPGLFTDTSEHIHMYFLVLLSFFHFLVFERTLK